MKKGENTRDRILENAAELFSTKGYAAASISDIMQATGLQKGGIYNHFGSKDQLALEAFDFAYRRTSRRFLRALVGRTSAVGRLKAIVGVFQSFIDNPPFRGGCMLLNTAIEADDTHPGLRQRARNGLDQWADTIRATIAGGIDAGEIRPDIDAEQVATVTISTLEGAIMMSKLYGDHNFMERAISHLTNYFEREVALS